MQVASRIPGLVLRKGVGFPVGTADSFASTQVNRAHCLSAIQPPTARVATGISFHRASAEVAAKVAVYQARAIVTPDLLPKAESR